MDYPQTLEFLYNRLPMFQRVGAQAFKKDLTNTLKLCEALDSPQRKFRSVHVAGTNGKGSVSHSLAAIFQQAGYKTGLYTSPHLVDFRERIRVDGQMIPEPVVVEFVKRMLPAIEELKPSFFEMTVALAFDFFAQQQVDIAIVETGMGGKFDSTNVITPELSVITNISMDHQQFLGNTEAEIAGEKAGIIKSKVPVVIGRAQRETKPVFRAKAAEMEASIHFAEKHYQLETESNDLHQQVLQVRKSGIFQKSLKTDLTGEYQVENLATVLTAVEVLKKLGFNLSEEHVEQAMANVKSKTGLRGRFEILQEKPMAVCDVAHNKAGLEKVLQQVSTLSFRKLHFVLGMVSDKDIASVLSILPADARYYFCKPDLPRGLSADVLAERASAAELRGEVFASVVEAYHQALINAAEEDLVLVSGSAFVVAEVLQ
ncbi:MAG: folylpolyglutamate synthase/dihydrofolate synthase family protein [Bacteroidia bacterium]